MYPPERYIVNFKEAGVQSEGSWSRWKPMSFPKSLPTDPQFLFPRLPNGNIYRIWSLGIQTMKLRLGQSSMAGGSVPPEHCQHSECASAGYWMERWKPKVHVLHTTLVCFATIGNNALMRMSRKIEKSKKNSVVLASGMLTPEYKFSGIFSNC